MSYLLRGAALTAAGFFAVSAMPASAIVYVVTLGGETSENFVEAVDGGGTPAPREDFAAGAAFSATLRFDTDLLPMNDAGSGEDFRFEDGTTFFTATVTFAGGGLPAFGGVSTRNSLVGAFGGMGYVDLNDDRIVRDDADAYESATLYISGFDGLQPVAGGGFPDFLTAQNLSFTLSGTQLDKASGASRSGYAFGLIDRVSVTADSVGVVPEPASWVTMALGFGLLGAAARRRRAVTARA